jgi:3-methylcrotonyl-CoA carboxylase alpha subunit
MNLPAARRLTLRSGATDLPIRAEPAGPAWRLTWGNETHTAALHNGQLTLGTTTRLVTILRDGPQLTVLLPPHTHSFDLPDPLAPPRADPPGADHVLAPIPGRIASVLCRPGDTVARGQTLLVMEAMKMELPLTAAMDGTIAAVRCAVGDMVPEGADLIAFDTQEGSA